MDNFIVYNTHLEAWDIHAFGPERQDGYTAYHHHHQGQNRPHQKTITHPHAAPRSHLRNIMSFLGRGEGVVHSPLPRHRSKQKELKELLLFDLRE